jgi:hypothetical protein
MNIFSDEDLKRLKADVPGFTWAGDEKIYALIARLEAAEKWAHAERSTTLLASPEYLEWRKAAGK